MYMNEKMNKIIKMYAETFPNIEIFYKNNGGRRFAEELLSDRSSVIEKITHYFPIKWLYNVILVLEPIISLFIIIFLFCKTMYKVSIVQKFDTRIVDRLFLISDNIIMISRCKAAGIYEKSEYWLIKPFTTKQMKELDDKIVISTYDILKYSDVIKAFIYSISAVVHVCLHNPQHYLRQPFKSFGFYLTYLAILKFSEETELVFHNHIDRWAVLVDHCPQKRKVLVQHGIESKKADWPVKLSTVTTVYAFNEELGKDLKKALLTNDPEFIYMKATIELTADEKDNNYKVLIVCHPTAFREREEYLISHLQRSDITVYAKTHPTTKDVTFYKDLMAKYRFHLITGKIYPKVNTLVSYRSTIVYEYEYYGIPTIMYYDKTLDEIIESVTSAADEWKNNIVF